jgi:hypothetical protein
MGKLRIRYVQRLPHCAEDLPPDVVELWIRVFGRKVDVNIVRRGFILAAPVDRRRDDEAVHSGTLEWHRVRERLRGAAGGPRKAKSKDGSIEVEENDELFESTHCLVKTFAA